VQNLIELAELCDIVDELQPTRTLEIGCYDGGTLWHWKQATSELVYAIDPAHRRADEYDSWPGDSRVFVDYGLSQDDATVARARVVGAPYDFVFVDGDHHYDMVLRDVLAYWPLLRPGGIMALHDIAVGSSKIPAALKAVWGQGHADEIDDAGPAVLWAQLTRKHPWSSITQTITAPSDTNPLGIGVIRKP
jgi:predicted O-methyltransferase YrrM